MWRIHSQLWQIGLDIQNRSVQAIALQRRRHGWQLRQWWRQPLSEDVLCDERLEHPQHLIPVLRRWRNLLPRRFSLRIALPAPLVLQHCLPPPAQPLDRAALTWYVKAQLASLLPLGGQAVALDYRQDNQAPHPLYVTMARQQEMNQWLACLAEADLVPQVVEITPCVLRTLARNAGVAADHLLLHSCDTHWLWASPWEQSLSFGVLPLSTASEDQAAQTAYLATGGQRTQNVCYSKPPPTGLPTSSVLLSPLSMIQQLHPPLPEQPAIYALAIGLALRGEDAE